MARERLSANFYADELWCKHCQKLQLHAGFISALQALRDKLGEPVHPTSGCRCAEYNAQIGGHPKSLHVLDVAMHPGQRGTLAVDLAAPDGPYRGRLFAAAWSAGFSVGWNAKRGFLHLDRRDFVGLTPTTFDY